MKSRIGTALFLVSLWFCIGSCRERTEHDQNGEVTGETIEDNGGVDVDRKGPVEEPGESVHEAIQE